MHADSIRGPVAAPAPKTPVPMPAPKTPVPTRNIMRLAQLFPDCVGTSHLAGASTFTVDVPRLLAHLGVDPEPETGERFELQWPGKAQAQLQAQAPLGAFTLQCHQEQSRDLAETGNLFFEGDNLTVLKLLQPSYQGAIKLIYLDPPYNTGSQELVYHDKFRARKVRLSQDSSHVHAPWCSMIYERLLLARPLLSADGVIFASIDEREYANLRQIMDEVLGASNFVSTMVWKKKQGGSNDAGLVVTDHEYILVYAKDITKVALGLDFGATPDVRDYNFSDEHGRYNLITLDKSSLRYSPAQIFDIVGPDGTVYRPRIIKGRQSCWRWSAEHVAQAYDQLVFKDGKVYTKNYLKSGEKPRSLLIDSERFGRTSRGKADLQELFTNCPFSYPKPVRLLSYLIGLVQGMDFTVLDLFAGSATTAQAVMECNAHDGGSRHFIMVQIPEPLAAAQHDNHSCATLSELALERIRRAASKISQNCTKTVLGGGTQFGAHQADVCAENSPYYDLLSPAVTTDNALIVHQKSADLGLRVFSLHQGPAENSAPSDPESLFFSELGRLGLPLHLKLQRSECAGGELWDYGSGLVVACWGQPHDSLLAELVSRSTAPQYLLVRATDFVTAAERRDYQGLCSVLLPATQLVLL